MATEAGLKPVLGVELDVSPDIHEERPSSQPWVFIAQDSLQPINRLVTQATTQFRYRPLLTLEQAINAEGVTIMAGASPLLDLAKPITGYSEDLYLPLGPSTPSYVVRMGIKNGWDWVATGDNVMPLESDRAYYEMIVGRNTNDQTYPQHILDITGMVKKPGTTQAQ